MDRLGEAFYREMKLVFKAWMGKRNEAQFVQKYRQLGRVRLGFRIDSERNMVVVGFLHDGTLVDTITKFSAELAAKDFEGLAKECLLASIVVIVAGDKIYGELNNPFRKAALEREPDFGLAKRIYQAVTTMD